MNVLTNLDTAIPHAKTHGIVALPKALEPVLRGYLEATAIMRAAAKAEKAKKTLKATIVNGMGGEAGVGRCGSLVATAKEVAASAAQVKTVDGRELPLEGVTFLFPSGIRVEWGQVVSVYGGRESRIDLDVVDTLASAA